jgi:hypothetical protein
MARLFEVNMHMRMHDDFNGHMGDVSSWEGVEE